MFEEMSRLTSVVMAKCVAAYQDDRSVSRIETQITDHAFCAHKPIARTTKAVMLFMGELACDERRGASSMNEPAFEGSRETKWRQVVPIRRV